MGDKDDGLLLSLGLSCAPTQQPPPKSDNINVQTSLKLNQFKNPWHDLFPQPEMNNDTRSFLRGIDMNRVADCEDENGVSSPNSTISSVSGKRSGREAGGDETEAERASCSPGSDDEDGGGGDGNRKKLRLSKEQSLILEETFKEHNTLNPKQKQALAKQLNLRPRQVEVWFQNRRARTKLKQTEVDCEYLKRCCENLTEENRRLHKEVQELRALKLSPQLYMNMNPPTTLTMCPSCERVAVSSSSSSLSSSTVAATSSALAASATATRLTMAPNHQRPMPMVPWAGLPVHHRPFDAPPSRS